MPYAVIFPGQGAAAPGAGRAWVDHGAWEVVAEAEDRSRAALAPPPAAEIYGLKILRNDMQDSPDNRARFVVLER